MEVSTKIHMTHISEVLLSSYYKRRGNGGALKYKVIDVHIYQESWNY